MRLAIARNQGEKAAEHGEHDHEAMHGRYWLKFDLVMHGVTEVLVWFESWCDGREEVYCVRRTAAPSSSVR